MNMNEALTTREERYRGWSACDLKKDACMDMLRLLNVFSDIEKPCKEDILAMHCLAEAVGHLDKHESHHFLKEHACKCKEEKSFEEKYGLTSTPEEWEKTYCEIAKKKKEMDEAFNRFMNTKMKGQDASNCIAELFKAHSCLAKVVMTMPGVNEQERNLILSFIKN